MKRAPDLGGSVCFALPYPHETGGKPSSTGVDLPDVALQRYRGFEGPVLRESD